MQDAGCGMQDAGFGMRDAGFGMRDAGCRMQDVLHPGSCIGAKHYHLASWILHRCEALSSCILNIFTIFVDYKLFQLLVYDNTC